MKKLLSLILEQSEVVVSIVGKQPLQGTDWDLVHGILGSRRLDDDLEFRVSEKLKQGNYKVKDVKIGSYVSGNDVITNGEVSLIPDNQNPDFVFTTRGSIGSNFDSRHDSQVNGLSDRLSTTYNGKVRQFGPYNISISTPSGKVNYRQSFFAVSKGDKTETVDNTAEIQQYVESYLNKNDCPKIRKDLELYKSAVDKGDVKLETDEISVLNDSIKRLKSIENTPLFCKAAKKEILREILKMNKEKPDKVKTQLCWMNKNIYSELVLSFCGTEQPPQNDVTTQDDNNSTIVDDPKKDQEIKVDDKKDEKPIPVEGDQDVKKLWNSKYSCLQHLTPKVTKDEDGDELTYKVETINSEEKVYYFLNGKCTIVKYDETTKRNVEIRKYFSCP